MSTQSIDVRMLIRNSIGHIALIIYITLGCSVAILSWSYLLASWPLEMKLIALAFLASLIYGLINPLSASLVKLTDRLVSTDNYLQRKALINIAEQINNIIDLEKIAATVLSRVKDAMGLRQASLLISEDSNSRSGFTLYSNPDNPTQLNLKPDNTLMKCLQQSSQILTPDVIDLKADIEEKESLKSAGVSLLCPIQNQGKLVAVLALSQHQHAKKYTPMDLAILRLFSQNMAPIIENAVLFQKARQQATTDELTGLFNQGCFHQRIAEEIARSTRFGEVFSLIFLDVDDFKQHNDIHGHLAGDQILNNLGRFIKSHVRDSDLCFRYGGDEFALVFPKTSLDGCRAVAERMLAGIPSLESCPELPLTVSMGIASWPTDGVAKDDLIRSADAALYHSKQTGKDRISLACEVALSEVFRIESLVNQKDQDSSALLKTIYTLASTVDAKDRCTANHSQNVTRYATEIARALGFPDKSVERIRVAALLHDIGKIGIPDRVLKKIGLLSAEEREIMQAHPNLGVSIIQHVESLKECLAGIQYHHENYNGTGYPSGLKDRNIPLDARILGVADAFDAMTSPRLYRRTFSYDEALAELQTCSGTQFDPEIVQVFLNLKDKLGLTGLPTGNPSMAG
jgi:diguanylate cyclase (GGDEF)-like protein/putative nucleotidyltransferase with HDIG domain